MSDEELRALAQQAVVGNMPLIERIFAALQAVRDLMQAENKRLQDVLHQADAIIHSEFCGSRHHPVCIAIEDEIVALEADITKHYQRGLAVKTLCR